MKYSAFKAFCRNFLLFAFAFLQGSSAQSLLAQAPAKFPENPNEFVDKLGEFMTASKRPDMEEAYTVFKKMYREARSKRRI